MSSASYEYATVDMTGDGKIDLVLTRDGGAPDADIGRKKWLVFPNTGTGFGPPQTFALRFEQSYAALPLDRLSAIATCSRTPAPDSAPDDGSASRACPRPRTHSSGSA